MGLLANGFRDYIGVYQCYGAGTVNGGYPSTLVANFSRSGRNRNFAAGSGIADGTVGRPYGYRNPGAWIMPQKAGALSSHGNLLGVGDISNANGWAVKLAAAAISGSGGLTATGGLIVQLVAAITGSGTISGADMKAFLQLAAAISGSGTAAGAATGVGALLAMLTGAGTAAGSTATGIGELSADLVVTGTGLTTANVGESVWGALAAVNNAVGTMGEKLNDAGSASNPWTEVIESGYTAAQILRLIAAAVQGNASGLEDGTPTFKGLDGTTDRIEATYVSGTRTVTSRDAT